MLSTLSPRAGAQPSFVRLVALGLLFLQFATIAEAGKFARICNYILCSGKDDDAGGLATTRPAIAPIAGDSKGVKCLNPNAPTDANGWGISKLKTFPTVDQIIEDYKLCGICSAPDSHSLFYTFGGGTTASNKFKKDNPSLNLHILADCMPQSFVDAANKMPGMNKANGPAQVLWIIRNSQAFAKISSGEVYVVTNGQGTAEQQASIYTAPYWNRIHPWMGRHNVWYDYEFGALQRNAEVKAMYTVQNHNTPLKADKTGAGAWVRGGVGSNSANYIDANTVTEAQIQSKMNTFNALPDSEKAARLKDMTCNNGMEKRADGGSCPLPGKSSSSSSTTLSTKTKTGAHSTKTATGAHATKTGAKATKTGAKATKTGKATKATKTPKKTTAAKSQKSARCRIGQEC